MDVVVIIVMIAINVIVAVVVIDVAVVVIVVVMDAGSPQTARQMQKMQNANVVLAIVVGNKNIANSCSHYFRFAFAVFFHSPQTASQS